MKIMGLNELTSVICHVYQFPGAVITNYHKLSGKKKKKKKGKKTRNLFSHSPRVQRASLVT